MSDEIITRYLIKVKKYVTNNKSELVLVGEDLIETDSQSLGYFPNSRIFADDTKFCFTLEFVEKRDYKQSNFNKGMIERI